jgi:eukaryotic-like serine/threonine-protein kinase
MGEVYRARDTRLGRDVAVKVLATRLSSSPELRARFEREARAISSLQHPHICTLFDVGRHEPTGTDYLVMEYLQGETLAARLERGPLPIDQLLKIAAHVADALDSEGPRFLRARRAHVGERVLDHEVVHDHGAQENTTDEPSGRSRRPRSGGCTADLV